MIQVPVRSRRMGNTSRTRRKEETTSSRHLDPSDGSCRRAIPFLHVARERHASRVFTGRTMDRLCLGRVGRHRALHPSLSEGRRQVAVSSSGTLDEHAWSRDGTSCFSARAMGSNHGSDDSHAGSLAIGRATASSRCRPRTIQNWVSGVAWRCLRTTAVSRWRSMPARSAALVIGPDARLDRQHQARLHTGSPLR